MANVKFEFSANMEHPTAGDTSGSEVWTSAPGFFKATMHWELGHTPDWIDCYFHAAEERQFPWVRVRATDENGPVGIWRFDYIEEQFEGGSRQWRAVGRCVLYGVVDNYMRSPRIKAEEDPTNDDDPNYTEWPILSPASLITLEDLEDWYGPNDFRVTASKVVIKSEGCGSVDDPCTLADFQSQGFSVMHCVFDRNSDRDNFLVNNFAESRFNQEPNKLGPNYTLKGVRRGWVFKDIMRHSSGSYDSASRPILAVYNRSLTNPIVDEGSPVASNFQQAQSPGAGANALAYDVAVSWPWLAPATQTEIENLSNPQSATDDTGYDYRTAWTGKSDTYADSGQAIEVFRRGSQEWDDAQGFSCQENTPCPDEGPDGVVTTLTYFQTQNVILHVQLDHFPTRAEICSLKPGADFTGIIGMGVIVTVIDQALGTYDLSTPVSTTEWLGRFPGLVPIHGPNVSTLGANGSLACENGVDVSTGGRCWCISHTLPSAGVPTGLIAIYRTPSETVVWDSTAPPSQRCTELGPERNIAIFLHKTDISKDYLCYHQVM